MLEDIRSAAFEISEQRLIDREQRIAERAEKELAFDPVNDMLSPVPDDLGAEKPLEQPEDRQSDDAIVDAAEELAYKAGEDADE